MVTGAKAIAALPELATGKPKVVQGVGMLNKIVFGRDNEGQFFFNTQGKVPEPKDQEERKE